MARYLDDLATVRLVDHHCHGVTTEELDRPQFEALISEGGAPPAGCTNFDTPVGLAIRRHCAPVLDLAPHASPEDYLARRSELGTPEVTRRLLAAAGTACYLVDTGYRPNALTTPEELAAVTGATSRHVVRLEAVAERVLAGLDDAELDGADFAAAFAAGLEHEVRAVSAVAVKSIAAYRVGLEVDPRPPSPAEISTAADHWLRRGPAADGSWRLDDLVLTRAMLWTAVELALPIQFHVGFGDGDIRMHRADPSLLTDWISCHRVPVMLLHCWPFHRQAAFLAAVHPHVHVDVGLALPYVGPQRAAAVLAEVAELAPFGKLLYSSDAFGVPELYHLGALSFRRALGHLLDERVEADEWSDEDAARIAVQVAAGNAQRVYRLEAVGGAA